MIMDALRHYGLSQQRTELTSAIQLPLRNTRRIKFTCFDVSEKYIIFGANSGSLYVYDRESVNFLSIIPSQLGTISQVQISSNGKQIAVANMRGAIGVVLDLDGSASKEVLLTELGGGEAAGGVGVVGRSGTTAFVTSFCWGEDDKELYCGDSKGTVSLLQLSMFMGRNILNMTLSPVLLLENHIVQIDRYKELLLVSTLSKCVLCNTQREEFKQDACEEMEFQSSFGDIDDTDGESDFHDADMQCSEEQDETDDADVNDSTQQDNPVDGIFGGIRCAAHTLQLAVYDCLKDLNLKKKLEEIRRITRVLRTTKFRRILKLHKKPVPSLDCETRWNYSFVMVKYFIDHEFF